MFTLGENTRRDVVFDHLVQDVEIVLVQLTVTMNTDMDVETLANGDFEEIVDSVRHMFFGVFRHSR